MLIYFAGSSGGHKYRETRTFIAPEVTLKRGANIMLCYQDIKVISKGSRFNTILRERKK